MAIQTLNIGAAPGDGTGDTLRSSQGKVNDNFSVSENAASKIVQASSADTTANKVMLSDFAWRGAQLGDYFTYGGTANAITLTSANLAAGGTLIAGMKFRFKATLTNTGATTITVDGGSTVSCVTPTGVALPAGFIRTDVVTECEYNGANFVVSRKVESGSNANGEWTRWEDGTQNIRLSGLIDQTNSTSNVFGSTSGTTYYARDTFTLPVSFLNTEYVGNVSSTGSSLTDGTYDTKGTGSVRITISSVSNGSTDNPFDAIFSGKWY